MNKVGNRLPDRCWMSAVLRVPDLETKASKSGTPTGPTSVASGGTGNGNDSAATGHVPCAIGVWACQQPVREVAPNLTVYRVQWFLFPTRRDVILSSIIERVLRRPCLITRGGERRVYWCHGSRGLLPRLVLASTTSFGIPTSAAHPSPLRDRFI